MADARLPRPPVGTRAAGKRLWSAVLAEYELEEHELGLLRELVRTTDLLDDLAATVRREGAMVPAPGGGQRIHPAAIEARQQRIALARLQAALRLPAGEQEAGEAAGVRRPQRRVGVRGVYKPRLITGGAS